MKKNRRFFKFKRTKKLLKYIFEKFYNIFSSVIQLLSPYVSRVKEKIHMSLRLQLLYTFVVCLLLTVISFNMFEGFLKNSFSSSHVIYEYNTSRILSQTKDIAEDIEESIMDFEEISKSRDTTLESYIIDLLNQKTRRSSKSNTYITVCDLEGHVLFKSDNSPFNGVDLYQAFKNSAKNYNKYSAEEITSIFPVKIKNLNGYVIYNTLPSTYTEETNSSGESSFIASILSILTFVLCFYLMTKKKINYITNISKSLLEISKGDLEYEVMELGRDELCDLARNINHMRCELKKRIESERAIEKTKNELITNVSHDLRTPLTSIIGYIGLIKDKKFNSEEEMLKYAETAFNKSDQLKSLISDLFEYTKMSNLDFPMEYEKISLSKLITQLSDEWFVEIEKNNLKLSTDITSDELIIQVDPEKTVRVFENLIGNATKYSTPESTIKIRVSKKDDFAIFNISNPSDAINEEDTSMIFERFYKLDKSRNSNSKGSGLGLAISKTIVERQNGFIKCYYHEQSINFEVKFKIV